MKKTLFIVILGIIQLQAFGQKKLIWTVFGQGDIEICNTDGTGLETLVSFVGGSNGLTVDQKNKHVYWTNLGNILRTDFNTQSIDTVISGLDNPQHIELDLRNNKLYWSDTDRDKIQRANLDGSSIEDVYADIALNPVALSLDTNKQQLYFSKGARLIAKIDISIVPVDTADLDTIVLTSGLTTEIEIDFDNSKLYWSNQEFNESKIQRCNLDGTEVEDLVVDLGLTYGIAIDKEVEKIYWTDWGGSFPKTIKKANLDGTNIENVIELFNQSPFGLKLIDNFSEDTGVEVSIAQDDIYLFPNPTKGILTIKSSDMNSSALSILDIIGRTIEDIHWNGQPLDISKLHSGCYFIQLKTIDRIVIKKVIKND